MLDCSSDWVERERCRTGVHHQVHQRNPNKTAREVPHKARLGQEVIREGIQLKQEKYVFYLYIVQTISAYFFFTIYNF